MCICQKHSICPCWWFSAMKLKFTGFTREHKNLINFWATLGILDPRNVQTSHTEWDRCARQFTHPGWHCSLNCSCVQGGISASQISWGSLVPIARDTQADDTLHAGAVRSRIPMHLGCIPNCLEVPGTLGPHKIGIFSLQNSTTNNHK